MCDYCGYVSYVTETQFMHNYLHKSRAKSHVVQCNRFGRKRCPRGPVAFVLQLGREWEKVWIDGVNYIMAVRTWARTNHVKIATEKRDDGYWARRV